MPTCDFYILCPYFLSLKDTTIKCEGCIREYWSKEERNRHIKTFCETLAGCDYAKALTELYERTETMDKTQTEIEKLQHYCTCKDAEITKVKREITNVKNKLEQEKQNVIKAESKASQQDQATKYIIKAKNEEVQKLESRIAENQIISEQKLRGMEMMVGYLCKKFKVQSFKLRDVRKFGLKYETFCSIPDMEDDEIKLDIKVKKDDTN